METNPLAHLQAQESATPVKDTKGDKDSRKNVLSDKEWELAIANAEDEQDVEAMKIAKQEEREEMADFEDEAPADAGDRDVSEAAQDDFGLGKVEAVAMAIESELMPVQRYALQYLENEFKQAGITLVAGVNFDKEQWERDQLRRIRDQDADRMYDEDEILYYEVSGCSQQVKFWHAKFPHVTVVCVLSHHSHLSCSVCFVIVSSYYEGTLKHLSPEPIFFQVYRELVNRLQSGFEKSNLDFGGFYEPPNPDDDKFTYINEPMYQDTGTFASQIWEARVLSLVFDAISATDSNYPNHLLRWFSFSLHVLRMNLCSNCCDGNGLYPCILHYLYSVLASQHQSHFLLCCCS